VRDKHIEHCSAEALALYLLLVTVADAEGLSYYSERTACQCLSMDEATLRRSRGELAEAGLIAYEKPLYQVLSLDPSVGSLVSAPRGNRCASIGEVLRGVRGGAA
jgi:hypothetical protein